MGRIGTNRRDDDRNGANGTPMAAAALGRGFDKLCTKASPDAGVCDVNVDPGTACIARREYGP